jgi:hypothetical protein
MYVVYPQYWNPKHNREAKKVDFLAKLKILVHQFGKNHNVRGETIERILDSSKLYQQGNVFGQTTLAKYCGLEKPIELGAITILWTKLGESEYLEENIFKYFKLEYLCQTMILGSMEDERMFSSLSFLKSKLMKIIDKHMDTCLRLYLTKYDINTFHFYRALYLWRSDCDRRGEYNTTNSSNEIDMEDNILEGHYNSSSIDFPAHSI